MSTASVVGFTQAITNLNSAGFIGLITTIPKLIAGIISLTTTFGVSEVAALGLKGVLDLLNINPVILTLSLITAAAAGVWALTKSIKSSADALRDAQTKATDAAKALSDFTSQGSEYETLTAKANNLTDAEEARLAVLKAQYKTLLDQAKAAAQIAYNTYKSGSTFTVEANSSDDSGGIGGGLSDVGSIKETSNRDSLKGDIESFQKWNTELQNGVVKSEKYKEATSALVGKMEPFVTALQNAKDAGVVLDSTDQALLDSALAAEKQYNTFSDAIDKNTGALSGNASAAGVSKETLDSLSGNLSSVGKSLAEFRENGSLSYSTISDIQKNFTDLDGIDGYINTLSSAKLTSGELAQTMGEMTTKLIEQKLVTGDLKDSDESLIASMLREAGVANADKVALSLIADSKAKAYVDSQNLTGATEAGLVAFVNEAVQAGYTSQAIALYTLKKQLANGFTITTSTDISNLQDLCKAAGMTAGYLSAVASAKKLISNPNASADDIRNAYRTLNAVNDQYSKEVSKAGTGAAKANVSSAGIKTGGGGGGGKSETELYVADIDKLNNAEQRLAQVQAQLSKTETFKDLSDSSKEQLENLNKMIVLYKDEQAAQQELNKERRAEIEANSAKLKSQGFNVLYDANANTFQVTNMERINKLTGSTTEKTNELRKAAESLIDTTSDLNKDNIDGAQKWLESLKSIKDTYGDMKDVISSAVKTAFDRISDTLNKEKESYEKQKSNMETAASTVIEYINAQKDALQAQNDELDKQISLQQKLEALDKAKTQRNKRIFKQNEGYVWSADQGEINSAQQDYDSEVRSNALDKKIKELDDYAKAWQDATDGYEKATNNQITSAVLGANWEQDVLARRTDNIAAFSAQYSDVCDQLNEDVYGSVAYQIKNLEDLSKEYDNAVEDVNNAGVDYNNVLTLISGYESTNYTTRLSSLSGYVAESIKQYQALAAAAAAASDSSKSKTVSQMLANGAAWGSASASDKARLSADSLALGTSLGWTRDSSGTWHDETGAKAFANGGVIDYTGLAMVHGANKHEVTFNGDSADKIWAYVQGSDLLAQSAANMLMANNISIGTTATPSSGQSAKVTIGDIYIKHADDAEGLAKDIKKRFPNIMTQIFYKK